jgi:membrane protein implicated in regulation of membrane protease activity
MSNDRDSGSFSTLGLSLSVLLFRNVYLTTRFAMFCLILVVLYCVSVAFSKSTLSRHAYSTTSLTGLLCTAVYVVSVGRGDVLLINNTTRPSTLPALTASTEAVLS